MLHYSTIESETLGLLRKLQKTEGLNKMRLVGGTSLALQIGHRKSIDIDLFGTLELDEFAISDALKKIGKATILKKTPNIYIYQVDGIKVDLVNYPYPWLSEVLKEDNLKLAGTADIGAMKLSAITGRGTKKDFIDLYFLLEKYNLKELMTFYNKKYHDGSEFLVLKSLAYFEDADKDADPVMLRNIKWHEVKQFISEKTEAYIESN